MDRTYRRFTRCRLKEVRAILSNGEWGQWLEVSINYSL
ncbi:DUF3102 domain-containing protein [Desulfosporosinus sp. SB140]